MTKFQRFKRFIDYSESAVLVIAAATTFSFLGVALLIVAVGEAYGTAAAGLILLGMAFAVVAVAFAIVTRGSDE